MAENYFDPAESAPVPGDTQSADASKTGVRDAWAQWTAKPENNAALLQFGIAMMQPRAQGQSSIGQFANSIGEAGEASNRNVATQNLEKDREAQREERLSTAEYRRKQGDAALTNADAYKTYASSMAAASGGKGLSAQLQLQKLGAAGFNKWVNTENLTDNDAVLQAMRKEFPEIKTKGDILNHPRAKQKAMQIFMGLAAQENPEVTDPAAGTTATPAPAQPAKPPPSATPPVPGARFDPGTNRWYTRGPNGEAVPVPGQ